MSGKEGLPATSSSQQQQQPLSSASQPPQHVQQQQKLQQMQQQLHQQQLQQVHQPSVSITLTPAPVDLVKTSGLRIPSVSGTSIQRVPIGSVVPASGPRPTLIAPQVSVVGSRPLLGTVNVAKPSLSVSNITMLPSSGRMTSLSAVRPGTRPVLAAPQPTRVTSQQQQQQPRVAAPQQPRSAVATPIIRGTAGVQALVPLQGGIVAHQVRTTSLATTGRVQNSPASVQWTTMPATSTVAGRTVPRPATVVSVGARPVSMTSLSYRPSLTVARPSADARVSLASPVTAKALISPGVKPIGNVQTHIGVGISPQVGVASQVALKPGLPSPRTNVTGQASPRTNVTGQAAVSGLPRTAARMVSPTPLVSLTPATHIQVPLVPTGPKSRVQRMLTPAGSSATSSGSTVVGPVQLSTPRTITLPYSGQQAKSGAPQSAGIPIARVPPQPSQAREGGGSGPGFVYLPVSRSSDPPGRSEQAQIQQIVRGDPQQLLRAVDPQQQQHGQLLRSDPLQSAPVNLTITDRSVRPPAMTMPSFTPTILYESGRSENSVTITTLPPSNQSAAAAASQDSTLQTGSAAITPARITPIINQQDQDKPIPGSPRPSILRKRDGEGTPVKMPAAPAGLTSPPHSPAAARRGASPPPRPDSSSGSSTVSVPSSAALSGDEQNAPPVQSAPHHHQEPSPRKKPRKQQLPPPSAANVSPEWLAVKREVSARDRLEWEGGRVLNSGEPGWEGRVSNWNSGTGRGWGQGWSDSKEIDQADDEEEMTTDEEKDAKGNFLKGKPHMTLKDSKPWKSRHNHFLRYTDVKPKDERRPTVNELANQKYVYQKINGWKIFHLSAGMEDIIDMESELSEKLQKFIKRIEESSNEEVVLTKIQELLKANIQRSKVIQEQLREAKSHVQSVFVHKPKMQDIILKYHNKRPQRRAADK